MKLKKFGLSNQLIEVKGHSFGFHRLFRLSVSWFPLSIYIYIYEDLFDYESRRLTVVTCIDKILSFKVASFTIDPS